MNTAIHTEIRSLDKPVLFLIISVFTKELFTINLGGIAFDLFGYSFFILYFLTYLKNINYSRKLFFFLLAWGTLSLISILYLELQIPPFLKQIIPITIIYFSCYDILIKRLYSLQDIFELYVRFSYYAAILGIIQWSLSLVGINVLIAEPGLLDSIAYEPSHYAAIIVPAAIYSFYANGLKKLQTLILFLSLILTFSFTSYFVLLAAMIIPIFKIKSLPLIILLVIGSYAYKSYLPDRILDRIEGIERFLKTDTYNEVNQNGTVVSFASNLDVALYSIKESPLWGSGLGGHETMYFKFFDGKSFEKNRLFGINYNSAHSLTIRILSEAGILGILLFIIFLFRSYIPKQKKFTDINTYHIISLACISHFLCKSLKLGGYFDYGTPFFLILLLVNYLAYKNYIHSNG